MIRVSTIWVFGAILALLIAIVAAWYGYGWITLVFAFASGTYAGALNMLFKIFD